MSILAAGICEKNGDLILSRQFSTAGLTCVREMEEAYPALLAQGSQHSAFERDGLRYIFESLDDLFVTLVSDADTSNILQDLKTLRLLTQLVKTAVPPVNGIITRKAVVENYYGITDAFDEVVTMGYSENLSTSQVQTFLKMESHEEKIQQIIERNKQLEAAEERKKKAKQLESQRHLAEQGSSMRGMGSGIGSGIGSGMGSGMGLGAGLGMGSGVQSYANSAVGSTSDFGSSGMQMSTTASTFKNKGKKLGMKGTSVASGSSMPLLAEPQPLPTTLTTANTGTNQAGALRNTPSPVHNFSNTTDISITEHLTIEFSRSGQIKTSRVNGTLNLFAGDRDHCKLRIKTTTGGGPSDYKPHPKIDRALFSSDRTLELKNSNEEFPASHVLLAKWTVDNVTVPITVACWVSDASDRGFFNVTLEYEINPDFRGKLENIAISVSLPTSNAHVADPASKFEQFDDRMVWLIPCASEESGSSGSFEFVAEADSESDFYPLDITFSTTTQSGPEPLNTFGKIDVESVIDTTSGEEIEFTKTSVAQVSSYVVR